MGNGIIVELFEKLRPAKNVEELMVIAKEQGLEIPEDTAKQLFMKMSELTDDELVDAAAGRGCTYVCPLCGKEMPFRAIELHKCE